MTYDPMDDEKTSPSLSALSSTNDWRWVRASDGIIGGVCLGLARQFDLGSWLVRLIWIASICFFGFGFFLYIGCLIAFPRSDKLEKGREKMLLGVCARIGRRGDVPVGLARLIALFLLCSTFGVAVVGYLVLYLILEEKNGKSII